MSSQNKKPKLFVNIDHIATLRNQRGTIYPNLLDAVKVVEENGAVGITAHLREDRRHIKDKDMYMLKDIVLGHLNMEMAATDEMQKIALDIKPTKACIVPEKREELTTEGGLAVLDMQNKLEKLIKEFDAQNIETSLFIEPDKQTIELSKNIGASVVELHTGAYANVYISDLIASKNRGTEYIMSDLTKQELNKISSSIKFAHSIGLQVNLGHGLDYENIIPLLNLKEASLVSEYNIGFSIISMSIFWGLAEATKKMNKLIKGV